jgi:hypothetical protein
VGLETRPPPEGRRATEASEAASDENRAGPQAPVPAASTPDLPDYANKADDLEAIKKAVDDAASVGGGLWLCGHGADRQPPRSHRPRKTGAYRCHQNVSVASSVGTARASLASARRCDAGDARNGPLGIGIGMTIAKAFNPVAPCVRLPVMKHPAVRVTGARRGDGTFVEDLWKRDA